MPPSEKTCKEVYEYEERTEGEVKAAEVAKALGIAEKTVYNCHYEYSKEALLDQVSEENKDKFTKLLEPEDQDLWEAFRDYSKNVKLKRAQTEEATIRLPVQNKRAYLVGLGDIHIENIMSYLDKYESDLLTIKGQKNLGVAITGDLSDNAVKYMDLNFETISTPREARRLAKMTLALIKDKIVSMSSGCHERHQEEEVDHNPIKELSQRWDKPYLGHHGVLNVKVGEQTYRVAVSHKGKGSSMYNDLHSGVRTIREQYPKADIAIMGHSHQAAFLNQVEQGQRKLMVNIGSYKQNDRYARSRGFKGSQAGLDTPIIELSAERRHWNVFHDVSILDRLDC